MSNQSSWRFGNEQPVKAPVAEASSGHYLYLTLYSMSKLTNFHRNGWNLNVLPHLPGSVLKHLGFVQGESNFETESCYLTAIKSTLPQLYTRFCGLQFVSKLYITCFKIPPTNRSQMLVLGLKRCLLNKAYNDHTVRFQLQF